MWMASTQVYGNESQSDKMAYLPKEYMVSSIIKQKKYAIQAALVLKWFDLILEKNPQREHLTFRH